MFLNFWRFQPQIVLEVFLFLDISKEWISYSKTSFEKNCFSAWASTLNMGLINKVDMVCLSPVAVCSDEGLTLETSAKHHIPQATNIPYQPC